MYMSQDTETIKERLDLAEIVGEYVQLKRVGGHFKGLCPFHQEKTPSFIVSPSKGIWHCFGCQRGGDHFSFIQEVEGLDFPGALKMLAERAGVTLQTQAPTRHDPRTRQFELLALAARFYHELLMNQAVGRGAKQYLRERGVKDETLTVFMIGYAPQQWDGVQQFLQTKGFADRELLDSGLVGRSQKGTLFDRFRGRIMFPIYDLQSRVVAFGGRITPWHATGEEGKYINSPETAIYSKRRVVYNLQRAKKSLHQRPGIVVEGYMDVVMMVQAGVENVVASSGTALTAEQIALLRRYTNILHFAFDGDAAGIGAAEAATREATKAGLRVGTILFPAGSDPADVTRSNPETLRQYLEKPTSLAQVLLRHLQETEGGAEREQVLTRIMPLVKQTTNAVQQGEMIQDIAATLHVPEAIVTAQVAAASAEPVNPAEGPELSNDEAVAVRPENLLLGLVILEPSVRAAAAAEWQESYFAAEPARAVWQAMRERAGERDFMTQSADDFIRALPEQVQAVAEALRRVAEEHAAHISNTPDAEARALLGNLKAASGAARLRTLRDRISQLSGGERQDALREFQAALKELSTPAT